MTSRKNKRNGMAAVTLLLFLLAYFGGLKTFALDGESASQILRVGYVENYGVITDYHATTGRGYGYEHLAEIAKYTGWTYEFVPCSWSEAFDLLESGKIDLFGPVQKTPEREQRFAYPENSMGNEYGGVFVSTNNTEQYYDDPQSFQGMRVGTEKGSYFNQIFLDYCKEQGIEVEMVYTSSTNFQGELQQGKYDAIINTSMHNVPNTMLVKSLSLEPYYFITGKNNIHVREKLDWGIQQVLQRKMYYHATLYQKYYGDNAMSVLAFSRQEKKFVEQSPTLKVVCDPNWAPISYNSGSENMGISVDVLEEAAKISGLNLEWVPVSSYAQAKELVASKQATLLIPHTETEEELGVRFTDSFYDVSTMLVGTEEIAMDKPMQVGVSNIQSLPAQMFMRKYPHFQMVPYDNINQLIEALQTGKEKFIYVNTYVYDEIMRTDGSSSYRAIPTDITYPLRFAVSEQSPPILLEVINKSIAQISQAKVTSLVFSNTVNRAYQMPFSRFVKENAIAVLTMVIGIFAGIMGLVIWLNMRNQRELERVAFVDPLTGLPTLNKFLNDAQQRTSSKEICHFLLVSVDIDNFKYINDVFGYEVGNAVLKTLAEHFVAHPSLYDIMGKGNADSFYFLIHGGNLEESLNKFTQMIRAEGVLDLILPENYKIVLSGGAYALYNVKESFASCCDKANIARKSAKGSIETRIQVYTQEMDTMISWKKEVTLSMEEALANRDFIVFLQPKYKFSDETLAGAEALVRWKHPQNGLLSPAVFLPLFESNGFIVKVDFYVFEEVCRLIRQWLDEGYVVPSISVNLSRMHLTNPNLVEDLLCITQKYQVPPQLLELELTESIVLNDYAKLITVLHEMKRVGFSISVDDFGSGYSSLYLLTELPVDVLKLDKGFLNRLSDSNNSWLIVEQVVELAKKLHLSTVAEGVETQRQVEFLRRLGCDLAQGYFFAKPMASTDFEQLLENKEKTHQGAGTEMTQEIG